MIKDEKGKPAPLGQGVNTGVHPGVHFGVQMGQFRSVLVSRQEVKIGPVFRSFQDFPSEVLF